MNRALRLTFPAVLTLGLLCCYQQLPAVSANDIIMAVDPTQSQITLSAVDSLFGSSVTQAAGSDTTNVSGHFLVDFDAVSPGGPASIQFIPGHGSSAYNDTGAGANFQPSNLPANFALQNGAGTSTLALRQLSWDWNSAPLGVTSSGQFASSGMQFNVLAGQEDVSNSNLGNQSFNAVGFSSNLSSGTSTLQQTTPGAWQLAINFTYVDTQSLGGETSTLTYTGTIHASAMFGAANVANVDPSMNPTADVLGGSAQVGGVSAMFDPSGTAGTFSAQQIPFAGLSNAAIAAAKQNPVFALSTSNLSVTPQIWDVQYSGILGLGIQLTFHYDPSLLPLGTDESKLGIWHYDSSSNMWQFGGTVDTVDHTIIYFANSLSPFELGLKVPEPSTIVLAGLGVLGLGFATLRKKNRLA
jgi:hypothetical protein